MTKRARLCRSAKLRYIVMDPCLLVSKSKGAQNRCIVQTEAEDVHSGSACLQTFRSSSNVGRDGTEPTSTTKAAALPGVKFPA